MQGAFRRIEIEDDDDVPDPREEVSAFPAPRSTAPRVKLAPVLNSKAIPGKELYVSSYAFVEHAFREFKITRTLVGSPVLHDEPLLTASGHLRTIEDVLSMPQQHAKGAANMLYFLLLLHEKMVNLSDAPAVAAALSFASTKAEAGNPEGLSEEDAAAPQILTLILVLLFQASGTFVNDRSQLLIRSTRLPGGEKKSTKEFVEAFSDWSDAHEWLSPLVTEVFFSEVSRVQLFFDRIGPVTKQWIVSHTSAGSAGPRRVATLAQAFGLRVPFVCKAVDVLELGRMIPEFVIAHIPGSFGELRLEGVLVICVLLKISSVFKGMLQDEATVFTACVAGFRDCLSTVDKDAFEASKNVFAQTCKSRDARVSLDKKLSDSLSRVDEEGLHAALSDLGKLRSGSACFDKSAADYENHITICRQLTGEDVSAAILLPDDRTNVPPASHYAGMTKVVDNTVRAVLSDAGRMKADLLQLDAGETGQAKKLLKDRSLDASSQESWRKFFSDVLLTATPQRIDVRGLVH